MINDYLESARSIIWGEPGLSDDLKLKMISQECILPNSRPYFILKMCRRAFGRLQGYV